MTATVAGIHLGIDTHGNRPAGNAVPDGSLYSCSTHSLVYKSNFAGNSWATWATLGVSGAYVAGGTDVAIADGGTGQSTKAAGFDALSPMTSSGDIIYGGASGTGTRLAKGSNGDVLTLASGLPSWAAPSGGGGSFIAPDINKTYLQAATSSTSHTHTIEAAASGQRLIVVINGFGRDVNTPTCTNVTFTEVLAAQFSTASVLSIYVGVVSGGSSGTSVTVTATGSNFIITDVYEVGHALTPTVVTSSTLTDTSASAVSGKMIGRVTGSAGTLFVAAVTQSDGTTSLTGPFPTGYGVQSVRGSNVALVSCVGVMNGTTLNASFGGGTSGADMAAGIVLLT